MLQVPHAFYIFMIIIIYDSTLFIYHCIVIYASTQTQKEKNHFSISTQNKNHVIQVGVDNQAQLEAIADHQVLKTVHHVVKYQPAISVQKGISIELRLSST